MAVDITQWAATVARVDRGIGLNVFLVRAAIRKIAAALGADHANGKRVGKLKRRSDCKRELADFRRIAVAQFHRRKAVRVNLNNRQIRVVIHSNQGCGKLPPVLQPHGYEI